MATSLQLCEFPEHKDQIENEGDIESSGLKYVQEFLNQETEKIEKIINSGQRISTFSDRFNSARGDSVFHRVDFSHRDTSTSHLLINDQKERILSELKCHQVMTIDAFTGCGKSTQVPQFILDEANLNNYNYRIAVTQPRKIAAISLASRVAYERNWKLGGIVGYRVGLDKNVSDDTRLTYMTTGVLLRRLISKRSMDEFSHIIIDEVHERHLETDLLLLFIRKIMVDTANGATKIILMSATLNTMKLATYLPVWTQEAIVIKVDKPNCLHVEVKYLEDISGLNFSMDDTDAPIVYSECYQIAIKVIEGLDGEEKRLRRQEGEVCGAVLVFLPGELEIETMSKLLFQDGGGSRQKWRILPLHSRITTDEQQVVFLPVKKGHRKIILATNIAESSITVPDIKYVIDFCLAKNLSCDPETSYTCLQLEWASKNQCIQRKGRCGRLSSGIVYRLVTKQFYDTFKQETKPEMQRSNLETVVLKVKYLNMGPPKSVLALSIDPPQELSIKKAVATLKQIGALTILSGADKSYESYDGDITYAGRIIAKLPTDIRFGRLILQGHAFDCLYETIIIAAGLTVKSPFVYSRKDVLNSYMSKLAWGATDFSDPIALLNVYLTWLKRHQQREFQTTEDEKKWSKSYFVHLSSLREMKILIDDLYNRLLEFKIIPVCSKESKPRQTLLLKMVIAGAFYPHYFTRQRPHDKDHIKKLSKDVLHENLCTSIVFHASPYEGSLDQYKKIIAQYVRHSTCIPRIKIERTNVVVTFDSRASSIGQISTAVYRAVKHRNPDKYLSFELLSPELASKMATETNEILIPNAPSMPGFEISIVKLLHTHTESPSEFYGILKENEESACLVADALEETKNTLKILHAKEYHIGQLCITKFKGKIYRARLDGEGVRSNELLVKLIDHGITTWSDAKEVYSFGPELKETKIHQIPALAIQCRLSNIIPSSFTDHVWCRDAIRIFEEYCIINNSQLIIQIYGIASCVLSGKLLQSMEPSINELLVQRRYADICTEPLDFQANYNLRERLGECTDLEKMQAEQVMNFIPESYLEPPKIRKGTGRGWVTLRGPKSPLEMTFSSLCCSASSRKVLIADNSINSVALEQNPYVPSTRLLIAANVSIAQLTGKLLARETTLMPPIPGLTGIITMLFAPKLEFRLNEDYTMYTGLLAGLGIAPIPNPDSKYESVNPDQDMELIFEAKIDNQDVVMVNFIRSQLNQIFTRKNSDDEIIKLRHNIRSTMLKLLYRKRTSIDCTWPCNTYTWTLGVDHESASGSDNANAIFAPHKLHSFNVHT